MEAQKRELIKKPYISGLPRHVLACKLGHVLILKNNCFALEKFSSREEKKLKLYHDLS
jgi:hypothetical protein